MVDSCFKKTEQEKSMTRGKKTTKFWRGRWIDVRSRKQGKTGKEKNQVSVHCWVRPATLPIILIFRSFRHRSSVFSPCKLWIVEDLENTLQNLLPQPQWRFLSVDQNSLLLKTQSKKAHNFLAAVTFYEQIHDDSFQAELIRRACCAEEAGEGRPWWHPHHVVPSATPPGP